MSPVVTDPMWKVKTIMQDQDKPSAPVRAVTGSGAALTAQDPVELRVFSTMEARHLLRFRIIGLHVPSCPVGNCPPGL